MCLDLHLLACPRCRSSISLGTTGYFCSRPECHFSIAGFPTAQGQPVLIDFDDSILDESTFLQRAGASLIKRERRLAWLTKRLEGKNSAAFSAATDILKRLRPGDRVLVIGGGTVGSGAETLYQQDHIKLVGLDIYPSPATLVVADAHSLPFANETFDAVWIQAVLEHVLDPQRVVSEIYRVLNRGGLVFADTPFMQPVHEGAYDFSRYSVSGHRWLFRQFELISSGATGGAGSALRWAIRYFVRGITRSSKLGRMAGLLFFWLRFFDRDDKYHRDAASGTHFFGRKGAAAMQHREIVSFYDRL